jgi:hypothetical protein
LLKSRKKLTYARRRKDSFKNQRSYEALESGRAFSLKIMGDHTAAGTFPTKLLPRRFAHLPETTLRTHSSL